jgi:hypothetical protein
MKVDYSDIFSVQTKKQNLDIEEVITAFFSTTPKWIDYLFELRHNIVALLGLKTNSNTIIEFNYPLQAGEKIGFFEIFEVSETEIILGENDTHLDFRVLVRIEKENQISVETLVEFKNFFGKTYFQIIKPFHKLIVASMLKGMLKKLESN